MTNPGSASCRSDDYALLSFVHSWAGLAARVFWLGELRPLLVNRGAKSMQVGTAQIHFAEAPGAMTGPKPFDTSTPAGTWIPGSAPGPDVIGPALDAISSLKSFEPLSLTETANGDALESL